MITEDLIAYIQAQLRKNISQDIIVSRLVGAGWHRDDVTEAFRKIFPPTPPAEQPKPVQDVVTDRVWSPIKIAPKIESTPSLIPNQQVTSPVVEQNITQRIKPIFSGSFSEAHGSNVVTPIIPNTPKVVVEQPIQKPKETQLEIRNEELIPALKPKVPVFQQPTPAPTIPSTPAASAPISQAAPKPIETPTTTPPLAGFKMTSNMANSDVPDSNSLPNGAILHSYQKAINQASSFDDKLFKQKRHTLVKWLILILILSAIGGAVFAFSENYIKIPSFNFSFIKKDPKTLLANAPIELNELKSYKIETNASISLPPLANITSGLVSGEAVPSHDKDSITLFAEGVVNNENQSTPVFDYKATLSSSLFNNKIITNLKYNNLLSLVTVPDLSELLGPNAPKENTILVPKGHFDAFVALLPDNIQDKVKKIDIDKLLSVGIPSYVNNETSAIFKDFVSNATVTEKSPDDIHGILSYHYELNADRQATKKFINEFINIFITDLSDEEKDILSERLGAISIDSLQVWIGKDDNKIHQYSFVLKTPLSRLIGLDDKGIAGNEVSLDWKTTYYDFDVHNDISIPAEAMSVADFMKEVNDMKVKDEISAFKSLASNFHNAVGNYGKRSNSSGSCTNPNPNSLFSPVGHPKGASSVVGSIASLMNDILNTTEGALSCYSTSNAWALSAPLLTDTTSSFCVDSTGISRIIKQPINGPVCK